MTGKCTNNRRHIFAFSHCSGNIKALVCRQSSTYSDAMRPIIIVAVCALLLYTANGQRTKHYLPMRSCTYRTSTQSSALRSLQPAAILPVW